MDKVVTAISAAFGVFLRGFIIAYRYSFAYFLGRQCRFLPTCSVYAGEAIKRHGPRRGVLFAVRRFCRCHPFGGSGYDAVPECLSEGDEPRFEKLSPGPHI